MLLALALAASVASPAPVARLADALARALLEVAEGRRLELLPVVDRTGRGGGLGLDLHALTLARLADVRAAASGPRLRASPVLTEAAGRLVASARVVSEPEGTLVDVISVSASLDGGSVERSPAAAPPAHAVNVVSSLRSPPLDVRPLDLAFLDDDRLLLLTEQALALYRLEDGALRLLSQAELPGPFAPIRAPAGLLRVMRGEAAAWALTNRSEQASLFVVEASRLALRQRAQALPWPGSASGVRYVPGSNVLELGAARLVRVCEPGWGVGEDGTLWRADKPLDAIRVGWALATLWDTFLVSASDRPPGAPDALVIVDGTADQVVDTLPLEGSIRALAARTRGRTARVVAAVETKATHLVTLELEAREP